MADIDIELKQLSDQNIFLSYRSRDEPEVHGLSVLLSNLGNRITKMGEFPAGRWADHIYDSLEKTDTLLIYLSRAPETSRLRAVAGAVGRGFKKAFKVLTRRPKEPEDWIREEFEYFSKLKGDQRKVVVYAEKDAVQPDYLQGQQMHFYVSQLTEIRQKWNQLKDDEVSSDDARRIIMDDLKTYGVNLDPKSDAAIFDLFGVHGISSALRYLWFRIRQPIAYAPLVAVILLALGMMFALGKATTRNWIPVPGITQTDIALNQSARQACQAIDKVCVSVSQVEAFSGNAAASEFFGYATPTCDSRLIESSVCPITFGKDHELTGVVYQKSNRSESDVSLTTGRFCTNRVPFPQANCVDPLGD